MRCRISRIDCSERGTRRSLVRQLIGQRRRSAKSTQRMMPEMCRFWSAGPVSISARCWTGLRRSLKSTQRFVGRSVHWIPWQPIPPCDAKIPTGPKRSTLPIANAFLALSKLSDRPDGRWLSGRKNAKAGSQSVSSSPPWSCCQSARGSMSGVTGVSHLCWEQVLWKRLRRCSPGNFRQISRSCAPSVCPKSLPCCAATAPVKMRLSTVSRRHEITPNDNLHGSDTNLRKIGLGHRQKMSQYLTILKYYYDMSC